VNVQVMQPGLDTPGRPGSANQLVMPSINSRSQANSFSPSENRTAPDEPLYIAPLRADYLVEVLRRWPETALKVVSTTTNHAT